MPPARLLRVFRMPRADRAAALEAAALFHACRALLWAVPVRRLRPLLGVEGPPDTPVEAPPQPGPAVRAVRLALLRASRATPDTCFAQALAGRLMLRRRGVSSTLTLGVRKVDGDLAFHAWLRAEGVLVNGAHGPRAYTVLQTYHDDPAPSAGR